MISFPVTSSSLGLGRLTLLHSDFGLQLPDYVPSRRRRLGFLVLHWGPLDKEFNDFLIILYPNGMTEDRCKRPTLNSFIIKLSISNFRG
ncbi:hypothetical protein L1887_03071 [Cichorium endivia]|nr:hypothetical protein L1887_03071 [Cichorium endivia]